MVKQYEVLKWASSFLKKYNREEKVAEILLQHHLNVSREHFFLMMRDQISQETADKFKKDIKRHALTGIPYQHITGYEFFYGRQFKVNEHVLIPRQETEELVHYIINENKQQNKPLTIADIGTGSGVIAITLSLELPDTLIYATDISEQALKIARENAKKLGANVYFLHGNFLNPLIEKEINPHIIVANPPYIKLSQKDTLPDTVRKYDPHIALFSGDNGLQAYECILKQSTKLSCHLENIYFEIGFDQGKDIQTLIKSSFNHSKIQVIKDLNNQDRIIHTQLDT